MLQNYRIKYLLKNYQYSRKRDNINNVVGKYKRKKAIIEDLASIGREYYVPTFVVREAQHLFLNYFLKNPHKIPKGNKRNSFLAGLIVVCYLRINSNILPSDYGTSIQQIYQIQRKLITGLFKGEIDVGKQYKSPKRHHMIRDNNILYESLGKLPLNYSESELYNFNDCGVFNIPINRYAWFKNF